MSPPLRVKQSILLLFAFTFKEPKQRDQHNKQYAYEVDTIKVLDTDLPSTYNKSDKATSSREGAYPVTKLLNGVEKTYDRGKKILEENAKAGETGKRGNVGKSEDGMVTKDELRVTSDE